MDILSILLIYISAWINTLHLTIGAAVITIAVLYFTRELTFKNRLGVSAIIGIIVAILGTGFIIPASAAPQLYYPLTILGLGAGVSLAYILISELAGKKLGWILVLIAAHFASYLLLLLAGTLPLIGESMLGVFLGVIPVAAIIFSILSWFALKWNPAWTPWWISGDAAGKNAFLKRIRRRKNRT